jgi:hypothetical protein
MTVPAAVATRRCAAGRLHDMAIPTALQPQLI